LWDLLERIKHILCFLVVRKDELKILSKNPTPKNYWGGVFFKYMSTSRLETFSDGVIAIIITIMVLELKVPHGAQISDLQPLIPIFFAYILSFRTIGAYWNNHHHLFLSISEERTRSFKTARQISPKIMWANLHLLFWLSLIPFSTAWLGENYTASWPTAIYGILLLISAIAFQILQKTIVPNHDQQPKQSQKISNELKGKLSLVFYILAVFLAFINPWFSDILFILVAIMWFIPNSHLEET